MKSFVLILLLTTLFYKAKPQVTIDNSRLFWPKISSVALTDLSGRKQHITVKGLSVFVMLSPECPLCKNYISVINQIQRNHPSLHFYGIIPGNAYNAEEINEFQKSYTPQFPLLIDAEKRLTSYFNATTTPECIFIDKEGSIKYRGLIDNWAFSLGQQRKVTTEHYLAAAIQATLENQQVITNQTRPIGCKINDL